jgi:hypothetical protein
MSEIEDIMSVPGVKILIKNSGLTYKQLKILLIWIKMKEYDIKKGYKIYVNKNKSISQGTFYRILSQARKNIKKAIVTLILLLSIDLININDLQKLFELINRMKVDDVIYDEAAITQLISSLKI